MTKKSLDSIIMEDFLYRIWTIEEQARTLAEKRKSLRGNNPCWKGYHPVGTKKKGGATVPNCVPTEENYVDNQDMGMGAERAQDQRIMETAAWQKSSGKNKNGGLNKKGVASYRAEHPGSKLQTAVTTKPSKLKKGSKDAKRRASFCARMTGMKKHNTSGKTAHDPNSRINKSLRKWHCESLQEFAVTPGDDDYDQFKKLARMWYQGSDHVQQAIEHTLDRMGWGISEVEDGSDQIQLVHHEDVNGDDVIVFDAHELDEHADMQSIVEGLGFNWSQFGPTISRLAVEAAKGQLPSAAITVLQKAGEYANLPMVKWGASIASDLEQLWTIATSPAALAFFMATYTSGLNQGEDAELARIRSQNQPKKEHIGQTIGFDSGAGNWADTGSRNKQM